MCITQSYINLILSNRSLACTLSNQVGSLDYRIVLVPGISYTLVGTIRCKSIEGCTSLLVRTRVGCDIITLHTNATAANRHMIDANAIAKMKNGVVLINTARGTLIDPEALINGLESGKIGAAGLDVVENENGLFYFNHMGDALQNRELAMLRSFPNVIFTPHTAFYTDVNVASMVESAFKAVRAMADGEQTPLEVRL